MRLMPWAKEVVLIRHDRDEEKGEMQHTLSCVQISLHIGEQRAASKGSSRDQLQNWKVKEGPIADELVQVQAEARIMSSIAHSP